MTQSTTQPKAILYYDGECPICQQYRQYIEMRKKYDLQVKNAREHMEEVEQLKKRGYDMNEGMILIVGKDIYHKHQVLVMLNMLTESKGLSDRCLRRLMQVPSLMKGLYPVFFFMRWCLLKMRGRDTKMR